MTLLTWIPAVSAAIAFTALAVNIGINAAQQIADRKISANSVLISTDKKMRRLTIFNGGKYPILDLQVYVGTRPVMSVGEQAFIAAGDSKTFAVKAELQLSARYPHDVAAYFADARGKYWQRNGTGLATRIKH